MQLLIKDLNISDLINNQWIMDNCYIAGGACVSNATRQPIHDVDIYFKTKDARDLFIEQVVMINTSLKHQMSGRLYSCTTAYSLVK